MHDPRNDDFSSFLISFDCSTLTREEEIFESFHQLNLVHIFRQSIYFFKNFFSCLRLVWI